MLAQISSGQVEPAIATMKSLEQSGSGSGRAQLYFKLGKLLERELERLKASKDNATLTRMEQSYRAFLTALTESKAGQTYESLQWAGESLLSLGAPKDAETVFRRVLNESITNPNFLNQAGANERLLRTKLRLSAALRSQGADDLQEARRIRVDRRGAARQVPALYRAARREGHAAGIPGRGQSGGMVGGLLPLAGARGRSSRESGRGRWPVTTPGITPPTRFLSRTRPRRPARCSTA